MPKTSPSFQPLVSIVIPNYLRFDLLRDCVQAIPAAMGDIPYEVVLVENGSPKDLKREWLPRITLPDHTRLLELSSNIGYPGACNKGVKEARGPLLMILTNDVILDPGAGPALVQAMDDPQIGVAGLKLVFPSAEELERAGVKYSANQRSPGKIQHVGLFTNLRGQVIHMYLGWSEDNPRVQAVREVYAVTGAAFMTRRKLFLSCGGFDPAFGAGTYEDVDYCLKVNERGFRIIVEQQARAKHYTGATAEKHQLAFPLNHNQRIFEEKWRDKLVWTEFLAW